MFNNNKKGISITNKRYKCNNFLSLDYNEEYFFENLMHTSEILNILPWY